MFAQALSATLRILIFRAGPQDFPYSPKLGLTIGCIAFTVLVNALITGVVAPLADALLTGLVMVGSIALITRMVLKSRGIMNRFQQTFNALQTTNGLLLLAMFPAIVVLTPLMIDFFKQVNANPELVNHPDQWPQFPVWAMLLIDAAGLWQLVVTAYIFRQAANAGVLGSIFMVLGLFAFIFALSLFISPILASMVG
jgi:hypothetical protein